MLIAAGVFFCCFSAWITGAIHRADTNSRFDVYICALVLVLVGVSLIAVGVVDEN